MDYTVPGIHVPLEHNMGGWVHVVFFCVCVLCKVCMCVHVLRLLCVLRAFLTAKQEVAS